MKLKVIAGAKEGAEIPLKKSKFVIGRASDCTLRAGSDAISRHHCVLLKRDGAVTVRDLGSRNGTFVNGERITQETQLANGDELSVGPLQFIFDAPADLDRGKKPAVKSEDEGAGEETLPAVNQIDEVAEGETVDAPPEDKEKAKKDRKKPGKLPPLPQKPLAKDSREAAADILREMARRR